MRFLNVAWVSDCEIILCKREHFLTKYEFPGKSSIYPNYLTNFHLFKDGLQQECNTPNNAAMGAARDPSTSLLNTFCKTLYRVSAIRGKHWASAVMGQALLSYLL